MGRIEPNFRRLLFTLTSLAATSIASAACADQPILEPAAVAPAFAKAGDFNVVLLGRGGGPNSASDLNDAVSKVRDGGTIRIFPGTWETTALVVDKAVTFVGTGRSKPVLRILPAEPAAAHTSIEVMNAGGAVSFENLIIDNTAAPNTYAVFASGTPRVAFDDVDMNITSDGGGVILLGTGAGEELVVRGGEFRGGLSAVDGRNAQVQVAGASFEGQGWMSIATYGSSAHRASLKVDDIDASACGIYACVYSVNFVDASITGSRFSNAVPTGPEMDFDHHVIFTWLTAGVIADNVIDGCGRGQCIAVSGSSNVTVENNEITAYGDQLTRIGIVVSDGFRGPARASTARVRNNTVTGIGTNPETREGHAVGCFWEWCGGIVVEGHSQAEIVGNVFENVNVGIDVRAHGHATGSDNVIAGAGRGIAIRDAGSAASLHANDVSGASIFDIHQFDTSALSDLTCNWWGRSAGPDAVQTVQGSELYSPWADAHIAGTEAVCSGS